jgi:hypothetical protein
MESLSLYASAFIEHWWPLASAGALLGIDTFADHLGLGKLASRIPENRRTPLRITAALLAVLISGYLTWSDEHASVIAANKTVQQNNDQLADLRGQLSQKKARMDFVKLEPETMITNATDQMWNFLVWFQNNGQVAAQSIQLRSRIFLSDDMLGRVAEEENMKFAEQLALPVSNSEIQPGTKASYGTNSGLTGEGYRVFQQGRKYLYLFGTLTYHDEISDKPITTEMCLFYTAANLNLWQFCLSGHNRISRQN